MRLAIALVWGSVSWLATTATIRRACAWWMVISCMNRVSSGSTAGPAGVAGLAVIGTLGSPGLPGWSTGALGGGAVVGFASVAEPPVWQAAVVHSRAGMTRTATFWRA